MNIIIEGPDGSGKSTLAAFLQNLYSMPIVKSAGPPKDQCDMDRRTQLALTKHKTIFDRHPIVSESIYHHTRPTSYMPPKLEDAFYSQQNIFIYCRQELEHTIKEHDTPEHLARINDNKYLIQELYDRWAMRHANVILRSPAQFAAIGTYCRIMMGYH